MTDTDKAISIYLNDHLAGAMLGSNLAEQIRDRSEGTPRATVMGRVGAEIEEGRQTLLAVMETLGVSQNPVKKVSGWITEKASNVKFSGASSGEVDEAMFMAIESLRIGVTGQRCLWAALKQSAGNYEGLDRFDLDALIERTIEHEQILEQLRMDAGAKALGG